VFVIVIVMVMQMKKKCEVQQLYMSGVKELTDTAKSDGTSPSTSTDGSMAWHACKHVTA
jgi:hypothetical protein